MVVMVVFALIDPPIHPAIAVTRLAFVVGANPLKLKPVCLILSLEPKTIIRSAFCRQKLPGRVPIVPGRPAKVTRQSY